MWLELHLGAADGPQVQQLYALQACQGKWAKTEGRKQTECRHKGQKCDVWRNSSVWQKRASGATLGNVGRMLKYSSSMHCLQVEFDPTTRWRAGLRIRVTAKDRAVPVEQRIRSMSACCAAMRTHDASATGHASEMPLASSDCKATLPHDFAKAAMQGICHSVNNKHAGGPTSPPH